MRPVQWGIIGCGNVTEVKSGPAFNKVPDSKLVAVMRRNEEKVKDYAQRHGVEKWYTSADDLIADPEVTAVYIATPPLYHEEYTLKALQAGKPVYVEKPMALDAAAAARMADAAQRTGVKLCVAHYRREQPLFRKVKAMLEEGVLGKIRLVQLHMWQPHQSKLITQTEDNWRLNPAVSGGGLFHDLAPHQLDLVYHFFGKPLVASGIALNTGGYYEAADTVSGHMLLPNGVVFQGSWSFVVPAEEKRDELHIIGERGSLSFPIFDHHAITWKKEGGEEQILFDGLQHVQQPMIEKVVQYFLGNAENPCPADEGAEVMRMMEDLTPKR
jgi:predicted dehydrogenase